MMLDGIHSLPDAFEQFIKVLVKYDNVDVMKEFCNVNAIAKCLENDIYISCDYDKHVVFLRNYYDKMHALC